MFDFSFGEIGILAVVALVVLGPQRLPKVARTSGALLRKARRSWQSVRDEIEREFAAEELKRSLKDTLHSADPRTVLDDTVKDIHTMLPQNVLPADPMLDPTASVNATIAAPAQTATAGLSDAALPDPVLVANAAIPPALPPDPNATPTHPPEPPIHDEHL